VGRLLADPDFWKHASIPFVAGFVGWATNWVAVRMTFRPLEFRGIRPWLGWQGVIPSKATKMASIFVERTMFRLGTLDEVFRFMDPDRIAVHVYEAVRGRLDAWTDEIMFYGHPGVWELVPAPVKRGIRARVHEEMPARLEALMRDAAERVEELIDFEHMLVTRLERDRDLLNRLFLEAGAAEFRFIVRSGAYFGFLFGLVQLAVWIAWPAAWVLPVFGALVGWATNWFALEIIFRPLRPRRIGPWTVQGLFLKRQKEVAATWCVLVTTEILTLQHLVYEMVHGRHRDRTEALIKRHLGPVVERAVAGYGAVAELAVGGEGLRDIAESVGRKAVEVSTDPFDHWPFNRERGRVIEAVLRERMQKMPPEEFQDLLRPCFQEDEWKLIAIGGVLGLLAGVAQLVFVFGPP